MSQKMILQVEGMSCGHCKMTVENTLKKIDGVLQVEVSLEGKKAEITYDPARVGKEQLVDTVKEEGYQAF